MPIETRGSALLAVLWLTAALSAIAFSVANTVRAETERTSTAVDSVRAYYLATGAINRAILRIEWGPGYRNPDGTSMFGGKDQGPKTLSRAGLAGLGGQDNRGRYPVPPAVFGFVQGAICSQKQTFRHSHRASVPGKGGCNAHACCHPSSMVRISFMGNTQIFYDSPNRFRRFNRSRAVG